MHRYPFRCAATTKDLDASATEKGSLCSGKLSTFYAGYSLFLEVRPSSAERVDFV